MKSGLCSRCHVILANYNCRPNILKDGSGYCLECSSQVNAKNYKENSESRKEEARQYRRNYPERVKETNRKIQRSLRGRFSKLKRRLKDEKILSNDMLWNFNFFVELIKDGICHYCLQPLNLSGHGLDRKDSTIGHVAYNVVPCCRFCNTIKSKYWEYEHMMLLAPKLRRIRQEKLCQQLHKEPSVSPSRDNMQEPVF